MLDETRNLFPLLSLQMHSERVRRAAASGLSLVTNAPLHVVLPAASPGHLPKSGWRGRRTSPPCLPRPLSLPRLLLPELGGA